MTAYSIRRISLIIPTIVLVALIVFLMVQFIPGSVVEEMLSQMEYQFRESDVQAMKEALGVDVPIYVQFGRWFGQLFRGSLGNSLWTNQPVADEIMRRLPVSLELGLIAFFVGMIVALPIGVYSAIRQDTWLDYIGRSVAILSLAVPGFWVATMVMVFPSIWWGWTPPLKYIPFGTDPWGNLGQFILPGVILGLNTQGTTMRMTRTMMLEVMRQDYIRTAWAKGLNERVVVLRHAMKNALIPVVTIIGIHIPMIVGGSVIIEQIFNLPGIGRYLLESIQRRDYVVLAGVNMFVASTVLFANLGVDLSYAYLDPRIHYK